MESKKKPRKGGVLCSAVTGTFSLDGAGGDHVHRAEDDLPRKVECGPEVAIKDAEGARIAPDGADGAGESHERAHLVARGACREEGGNLGCGNVGKGSAGGAGAGAGAREHMGWDGEERAHQPVQPVRDEEGVEWGEGLCVGDDKGHDGHGEHAVGAHLGA